MRYALFSLRNRPFLRNEAVLFHFNSDGVQSVNYVTVNDENVFQPTNKLANTGRWNKTGEKNVSEIENFDDLIDFKLDWNSLVYKNG